MDDYSEMLRRAREFVEATEFANSLPETLRELLVPVDVSAAANPAAADSSGEAPVDAPFSGANVQDIQAQIQAARPQEPSDPVAELLKGGTPNITPTVANPQPSSEASGAPEGVPERSRSLLGALDANSGLPPGDGSYWEQFGVSPDTGKIIEKALRDRYQPKGTENGTATLNEAAIKGTQSANEKAMAEFQKQLDANTDVYRLRKQAQAPYALSPEQNAAYEQRLKDNPLTQMEIQVAQELRYWKGVYDSADNIETQKQFQLNADGVREFAHDRAEQIRSMAQAAGLNMEGFGSNVPLEDTGRYLDIDRARVIQDLTSGMGKYSRNPDQIYEVAYFKAIGDGYSDRQAKKYAAREAQQYAFDQRNYLDNAIQNYGIDGGNLNQWGTQLLAHMGINSPEGAALNEYYSKEYGSPKDIQTQANALEQLDWAHALGLEDKEYAALINAIRDAYMQRYGLDKIGASAQAGLWQYRRQKGVDEQFEINKENRVHVWEKQKQQELDAMIDASVADPQQRTLFKLQVRGLNVNGSRSSNPRGTQANALITLRGQITKEIEGVNASIYALRQKGEEVPDYLTNKLKELEQRAAVLENTALKELGYVAQGDSDGSQSGASTISFSGSEEDIRKNEQRLFELANGDMEKYKKAFAQVENADKLTDEQKATARQLLNARIAGKDPATVKIVK